MPVPKRKNSKSRSDKRHANKGLKVKNPSVCQTCNSPIASHKACAECGYYKGVKVLRTKTDRMHDRGQIKKAQEDAKKATAPVVEAPAKEDKKD